jgi:hypothetical protein
MNTRVFDVTELIGSGCDHTRSRRQHLIATAEPYHIVSVNEDEDEESKSAHWMFKIPMPRFFVSDDVIQN